MSRFRVLVVLTLVGACSSTPAELAPESTAPTTVANTTTAADRAESRVPPTVPVAPADPATKQASPDPVVPHSEFQSEDEEPSGPPEIGPDPNGALAEIDIGALNQLMTDFDALLIDLGEGLAEEAWDQTEEEAWKGVWEEGEQSNE